MEKFSSIRATTRCASALARPTPMLSEPRNDLSLTELPPMTSNNWFRAGLPAFLTAMLAAVPAFAEEAPKIDSGDTAWMLTSVALVLMMTIPGLGLFYGGMVRKKNVGDTVMTSFAVTCLVTILFAILTYSMAFRAGSPFVGGLDRMFLKDILSDITKGGIRSE